jgi:hypothetical protein
MDIACNPPILFPYESQILFSCLYLRLFSLSSKIPDPWKMGPIGCPETSARNHHYTLRKSSEERSAQVKCVSIFRGSVTLVSSIVATIRSQSSTGVSLHPTEDQVTSILL